MQAAASALLSVERRSTFYSVCQHSLWPFTSSAHLPNGHGNIVFFFLHIYISAFSTSIPYYYYIWIAYGGWQCSWLYSNLSGRSPAKHAGWMRGRTITSVYDDVCNVCMRRSRMKMSMLHMDGHFYCILQRVNWTETARTDRQSHFPHTHTHFSIRLNVLPYIGVIERMHKLKRGISLKVRE